MASGSRGLPASLDGWSHATKHEQRPTRHRREMNGVRSISSVRFDDANEDSDSDADSDAGGMSGRPSKPMPLDLDAVTMSNALMRRTSSVCTTKKLGMDEELWHE